MKRFIFSLAFLTIGMLHAQTDTRIYDIINNVSTERIKADITTLANFGTRHTYHF